MSYLFIKKDDEQVINNYRPVSLLPIFGKIIERIIFNNIYRYLDEHNLLNPNQSGFRPKDSCVYQLLEITHIIFSSFDCNPTLETRAVFLDISKSFDKVWHEGLIFKLQSMGISGNLLNLMNSFLSERYQRVLLNGQSSEWASIKAGVPQGSILGPLLFLIYINDLSDGIISDVKMFADDTSIFSKQLIVLITISRRFQSGLINGKCHLIQTLLSKLMKLFFPGN